MAGGDERRVNPIGRAAFITYRSKQA